MTASRTLRAAAPGLALAAAVLIAAILALAAAPSAHASAPAKGGAQSAPPCDQTLAEDDPGWDWTCMGNGYRGVVTAWGTPLVVSAHRFCLLYRHHNLSYPRSEHLRGDRWAIRHAC